MSFLRHGGLFVPTPAHYQLGDQVVIVLSLLDEPETMTVSGRVVWITPKRAQGSRETGIGVELSEQDAAVIIRLKIIWAARWRHRGKRTLYKHLLLADWAVSIIRVSGSPHRIDRVLRQ